MSDTASDEDKPEYPPSTKGSQVSMMTDSWIPSSRDSNLSSPIYPGVSGKTPAGGDLDLHLGWDRFEKLILELSRSTLGIRDVQMRRYGTLGQAQHGIDLAGREPDNRYTVIQCKEYQSFSATDLREAVEKFANGIRPFDAYRLIVATSGSAQSTQIGDELLALQDQYLNDLEIELWGAEEINDLLRSQGNIVSRFWTRETANDFCTSAPLAGVPTPPPDKQQQAEQILLGPLNTDEVVPLLRSAESKKATSPAEAAALYGDLASRLENSGFRGHSSAMRLKQLEVLRAALHLDEAADLAAFLAVLAIWEGDRHEARNLGSLLETLAAEGERTGTPRAATSRLHFRLVEAVVDASLRVTGLPESLIAALRSDGASQVAYFARLVLVLAEDVFAEDPKQLGSISDLIEAAISMATAQTPSGPDLDVAVRLRLIKAEYDHDERLQLAREARRHLLPMRHASIISAREARRCCLEGRLEDALENWRDAIQDAIHCGMTEIAAQWLYAIRALNIRYGPWTVNLDEEHRLAQALKVARGVQLISVVRDPREEAMSALVRKMPIDAVISARRWLRDSAVSGAWASEIEALEFVGDLYRDNREIEEAAKFYLRSGTAKKLKDLSADVKDTRLPIGALEAEPWWVLRAEAMIISAQEDLLGDGEATEYIDRLFDLAQRGREGALPDSPTGELFLQATKSLCEILHRGTIDQGERTLQLLASNVERQPGQSRHTDEAHAEMCVRLACTHRELAEAALNRLFDLAEVGSHRAIELMTDGRVLRMLVSRDDGVDRVTHLSAHEAATLRERALQVAERQGYLGDAALASLEPDNHLAVTRAKQARDRLLQRIDPDPNAASFGGTLTADSYLVSKSLSTGEQNNCLNRLLVIANDARETASNRQDALAGIRNLVIDQPSDRKLATFNACKAFVLGDRDGSHFDEWTGEPHPLSSFKISFGTASLRGSGIRLAVACAEDAEDQGWVRDQALNMLSSDDRSDVQAAAVVLNQLPGKVVHDVEANLLVSHGHVNVRQLCSILCTRQPERFRVAALKLCEDQDHRVRITLAEAARTSQQDSPTIRRILDVLAQDVRSSVRRAASGGA